MTDEIVEVRRALREVLTLLDTNNQSDEILAAEIARFRH